MPKRPLHIVYLNDRQWELDQFERVAAEHGIVAHTTQNSLELHHLIRAHRPGHVMVDWQLAALPHVDFSRVRWPFEALRKQVMEGRTPYEAYRYMRDAEGVRGPLAAQLKELAEKVKLDVSERNGMAIAREVLQKYPRMKVALVTSGDVGGNSQFMDLKKRFGERIQHVSSRLQTRDMIAKIIEKK